MARMSRRLLEGMLDVWMYFTSGKHVSICVVDLLLYNIFLGCLVYFESGDIFGIEPGNWEGSALWLGPWVELKEATRWHVPCLQLLAFMQ